MSSSLTPVSNSYLADRDLRYRSKQIPWDGYQRAGLLSAEDVALIQKVSAPGSKPADIIDAEGETYASLYIRLLTKLSRNDTLQYITVLVGDMIADHDERIALFLSSPESPYTPLVKLLESPDQFVRYKSTVLLSTLLSGDSKPPSDVVTKLLAHLNNLLRLSSETDGIDIAVQSLEGVLRLPAVRTAAWNSDIVESLVELLKNNPSSQMQYQLVFCFWLLTFDKKIAEGINAKFSLIPLLLSISQQALKEKVTRISLATLKNLVVIAPEDNLTAMLVAKVLPYVSGLQGRKWSDEEVKEDVEFLEARLKESFEGLTTYDEYTQELASGQLSWTPPHKSEDFWIQNAQKLVQKEREQLKKLVALYKSTSASSLTLAVAANDLGQFAKYHEVGKKALEDLGVKARAMELLAHEDAEVKYQSLTVVQRMVGVPYA